MHYGVEVMSLTSSARLWVSHSPTTYGQGSYHDDMVRDMHGEILPCTPGVWDSLGKM